MFSRAPGARGQSRLCDPGTFGRQQVLKCIPSLHFCSSFSCSVTLSDLPHNLNSSHTESKCVSPNQEGTNTEDQDVCAETGAHPLEVVHVGGLNWSADEGQVVNFCRLLASLVRLDKQLQQRETNSTTTTQLASLAVEALRALVGTIVLVGQPESLTWNNIDWNDQDEDDTFRNFWFWTSFTHFKYVCLKHFH